MVLAPCAGAVDELDVFNLVRGLVAFQAREVVKVDCLITLSCYVVFIGGGVDVLVAVLAGLVGVHEFLR